MLLLHLLHHFLNSEGLSLVLALYLALHLLLQVRRINDSAVLGGLLFKLGEGLPELLEVGVLDKFLTFD